MNQHIVRFEVSTTLVMKLEVFRETMSYCLVTIYWLSELAAFLGPKEYFFLVYSSSFTERKRAHF